MTDPRDTNDTPWEEAMSRDFDARVRDLHEAPLDFTSVKGKARKIRRNRRAAVAGSIVGVAAIVTPVAVIAGNGDDTESQPPFVNQSDSSAPTEAADPAGVDYVEGRTWHQADGDEVELPKADQRYHAAVLWDGKLVLTRWDGEVFDVTTVIDDDGTLLDTFATAGAPVVDETGTTLAYIGTDGKVVTDFGDGEVVLGTVDMAAPGETVAWTAAAVAGQGDCSTDLTDCLVVYVNSNLGEEPTTFTTGGNAGNPVPGALAYADATWTDGSTVTYLDTRNDDNTVCGSLYDLDADALRWHTCDNNPRAISPDGQYVIGGPSYSSGSGDPEIEVLSAANGAPTDGRFAPEGGFIWSDYGWAQDGSLVFSTYDGATWHLFSMQPDDGATDELATSTAGDDVTNPFLVIGH